MPGRVSVRCGRSWACPAGLRSVLRVRRSPGETDEERDGLVTLERISDADENSCCLYVQCDPQCGEEIISLALESQARTIEVYAGEEYLGTSRGEVVCTVPTDSAGEVVTLHRTFLQMETPEPTCKVKLLSLGGRGRVLVSGISVCVAAARPKRHWSFPSLGSSIDLDSVRSMVEGSQLSSGAQQLMSMVQLQQKNHFPFGAQLQRFLGKPDLPVPGGQHPADGMQIGSKFTSTDMPFPSKTALNESHLVEDLETGINTQDSGEGQTVELTERKTSKQSFLPPGNDIKAMVSSFLQTSAVKDRSMPSPSLLPFLHSLCGEVNHLRIGEQDQQPQRSKKEESVANVERDEPGACSYLEEIISKQMKAMEKRLMDHIDRRVNGLQERLDARMVLLADLFQDSQLARHQGSGERPTNGEIHVFNDL